VVAFPASGYRRAASFLVEGVTAQHEGDLAAVQGQPHGVAPARVAEVPVFGHPDVDAVGVVAEG